MEPWSAIPSRCPSPSSSQPRRAAQTLTRRGYWVSPMGTTCQSPPSQLLLIMNHPPSFDMHLKKNTHQKHILQKSANTLLSLTDKSNAKQLKQSSFILVESAFKLSVQKKSLDAKRKKTPIYLWTVFEIELCPTRTGVSLPEIRSQ